MIELDNGKFRGVIDMTDLEKDVINELKQLEPGDKMTPQQHAVLMNLINRYWDTVNVRDWWLVPLLWIVLFALGVVVGLAI